MKTMMGATRVGADRAVLVALYEATDGGQLEGQYELAQQGTA